MSFGKNLRALREKDGIERKILAQHFEMPYNTLKNYENDEREPGHSFIIKVANYFGVTTDYLLDNDLSALGSKSNKSESIDQGVTREAMEVACAYDKAEFKNKNTVRHVLDLPLLPESDDISKKTSSARDKQNPPISDRVAEAEEEYIKSMSDGAHKTASSASTTTDGKNEKAV